jgi:hypothetical protein
MINYCAFLFSQEISFSGEFPTVKNNIPLQIINNHAKYFYVLRYNRPVHEMLIERRSKSDGRIIGLTPLRMDSVNASWFDYEHLDYIFCEDNYKAYFIFEKVLNKKRTIYVKTIDTSGHSSGFKEVAYLDREEGTSDFRFQFSLTAQNKLLIIGQQFYQNNVCKKTAMLYDLEKGSTIWMKKLPLENYASGFSRTYACSNSGNLYYVLENRSVSGYKRKYSGNIQVNVPVLTYDSLFIVCMPAADKNMLKRKISLRDSTNIKSITLIPCDSRIIVTINANWQTEAMYGQVFFFTQQFGQLLDTAAEPSTAPLNTAIQEKLTFYDGSDSQEPADKDYTERKVLVDEQRAHVLSGRVDAAYFKELLLWNIDLKKGVLLHQQVVPRKVFYLLNSARFKNIGEVATITHKDSFYAFLLENRNNRHTGATEFRYNKFSKQRSASGGNLVAYILHGDGQFEKKELYRSIALNFVPLKYAGNQPDFVFYLNKGKKESFAILNLERL